MILEDLFDIAKGKKPYDLYDYFMDGVIRFIQIDDLRGEENLKYSKPSDSQVIVCNTKKARA